MVGVASRTINNKTKKTVNNARKKKPTPGTDERLTTSITGDAANNGKVSLIPLEALNKAAQSVCKIALLDGKLASAFLCVLPFKEIEIVGLMTNNHVISLEELQATDESSIDLLSQLDFESSPCKEPFLVSRKQDVARWFANEELDATFLELKPSVVKNYAKKGVLPLKISTFEPSVGLAVAVVQYPGGRKQQIAFSKITEVVDPDFKHTVSTDYGSSGSPVIDVATWTVIGLHKKRSYEIENDSYNWAVSMLAVVAGISKKFRLGLKSSMRRKAPLATDSISLSTTSNKPTVEITAKSLLNAAATGNLENVREILKAQPQLLADAKDNYDDTALTLAAYKGQRKVVEFFIKNKLASVESRGFSGRTALMNAAARGHLGVVKFLIEEAGADIYAKATWKHEEMAIHEAAMFGHVAVVDYLLKKQPDLLDARTKENETPLHRAALNGQLEVVEFLINKRFADVDSRGHRGRTPLMRASEQGRLAVVQFLVESAVADIHAKASSSGMDEMAIHLAAYYGQLEVVEYLLQRDPSLVKAAVKNGATPIMFAIKSGETAVVDLLQSMSTTNPNAP